MFGRDLLKVSILQTQVIRQTLSRRWALGQFNQASAEPSAVAPDPRVKSNDYDSDRWERRRGFLASGPTALGSVMQCRIKHHKCALQTDGYQRRS
jgi:hypothetical protein